MTNTTVLTTADIDRAAQDDRWLGFGYLGARRYHLTPGGEDAANPTLVAVIVAAIDRRIIDHANDHGWTYEDLFAWANSKAGRHFADLMFDDDTARLDENFAAAAGWGLLRLPE